MDGYFVEAKTLDVYHNIALEECLTEWCTNNPVPILYLWKNEDAVIIGRSQNAFTECDLEYAKLHGIKIVRRMTGGGAVFHDEGDLNFSFILPKNEYNIEHTTSMIVDALKKIGIDARPNGRNDIEIDGKKISGNAFYSNEFIGLHHGTILHHVNMDTMMRVLTVAASKTAKHGISSVKSRVGNLADLYPAVSMDQLSRAIIDVFSERYHIQSQQTPCFFNEAYVEKMKRKYVSEEWNITKIQDYSEIYHEDFSWGNVSLSLQYMGFELSAIEIASDTLFADTLETIKNELNQLIQENQLQDGKASAQMDKPDDIHYERMMKDLKEMLNGIVQRKSR